MPHDATRPVIKIKSLAGLSGKCVPTSLAIGTNNTAAIVWLMKVETTCQSGCEFRSHSTTVTEAYHDDQRQDPDNSVRRKP